MKSNPLHVKVLRPRSQNHSRGEGHRSTRSGRYTKNASVEKPCYRAITQRRKRYCHRAGQIATSATVQIRLELHLVGTVSVLERKLRIQVGLEELVLRHGRQNTRIHRLLISLALIGHR